MNKITLIGLSTITALMMAFIGCTESHDQYSPNTVVNPEGSQRLEAQNQKLVTEKTDPMAGLDINDLEREPTPSETSATVDKNSKAPIVYGEGLANITLKTHFKQAKNILSRTADGPHYDDNQGGETWYDEGIYVYWRKEEPRTPTTILATTLYEGEIPFLPPINSVRTSRKLANYFPASDPMGEKLMVDLYNFYEKKPATFNCKETGDCKILDFHPQLIIHDLGRARFLYSRNEEKRLYAIAIIKYQSPGKLKTDFDLILGQFNLKDKNGVATGETVALGETWKAIKSKANPVADTDVNIKTFRQSYESQISINLTKSTFERSYKEPKDEETLSQVALFSNYKNLIQFDGDFVVVEVQGENVKLSLQKDKPNLAVLEADANKAPLGVSMLNLKRKPKLQKEFLRQVSDLVLQKWKAKFNSPDAIFTTRFIGFHDDSIQNFYVANISYFDSKTGKGQETIVAISEKTGFAQFVSGTYIDPFDRMVVPTQAKAIDLASKSIGGFKIGDEITISELDLGFKQATVTYEHPTLGTLKTRTSFSRDSTLTVGVIENQETKEVNEPIVRLHWLSLSEALVGVAPIYVKDGGTYKLKVKALSTSLNTVGVNNICGQASITAQFAKPAVDVVNQLTKAISTKSKNCVSWVPQDANGTNLIRKMYFPEQNAHLNFDDRELKSVTIYSSDIRSIGGSL